MKKIFREVGAVVITFLFIATNILIVMPNVAACDCYTAQTDALEVFCAQRPLRA